MQQSDYEYRGAMAQFWDLLRGDTSNWVDRFFFLDLIREHGQPVLDVGCGTGRLLLDFMAQGIDIDGMDNSPEMLALLRQKAQTMNLQPTVYEQTMATLDLPRRYRTIIVPSSSFQLLTEPDAAAEALRRFYAHLAPGGTLAMSLMLLWHGETNESTVSQEFTHQAVRPEDGAIVRRWGRSTYDVINHLEHTEDRYDVIVNGEVVASEHLSRSPATRGYSQAEAIQLLEAAGFVNVRLYSGFSFEPAVATDAVFPIVGTKPKQ